MRSVSIEDIQEACKNASQHLDRVAVSHLEDIEEIYSRLLNAAKVEGLDEQSLAEDSKFIFNVSFANQLEKGGCFNTQLLRLRAYSSFEAIKSSFSEVEETYKDILAIIEEETRSRISSCKELSNEIDNESIDKILKHAQERLLRFNADIESTIIEEFEYMSYLVTSVTLNDDNS